MSLLYFYVGIVSLIGVIFFVIMSIYSFINVEALKIKQGNNIKCGILMLICSLIYALIGVITYLKIKKEQIASNLKFSNVRRNSEESEKELKAKYQKHVDVDSLHEIHLDQL